MKGVALNPYLIFSSALSLALPLGLAWLVFRALLASLLTIALNGPHPGLAQFLQTWNH